MRFSVPLAPDLDAAPLVPPRIAEEADEAVLLRTYMNLLREKLGDSEFEKLIMRGVRLSERRAYYSDAAWRQALAAPAEDQSVIYALVMTYLRDVPAALEARLAEVAEAMPAARAMEIFTCALIAASSHAIPPALNDPTPIATALADAVSRGADAGDEEFQKRVNTFLPATAWRSAAKLAPFADYPKDQRLFDAITHHNPEAAAFWSEQGGRPRNQLMSFVSLADLPGLDLFRMRAPAEMHEALTPIGVPTLEGRVSNNAYKWMVLAWFIDATPWFFKPSDLNDDIRRYRDQLRHWQAVAGLTPNRYDVARTPAGDGASYRLLHGLFALETAAISGIPVSVANALHLFSDLPTMLDAWRTRPETTLHGMTAALVGASAPETPLAPRRRAARGLVPALSPVAC